MESVKDTGGRIWEQAKHSKVGGGNELVKFGLGSEQATATKIRPMSIFH